MAIFLSASAAAGIECRGIFTIASPNAMCMAWSSVRLAISMTFLVTSDACIHGRTLVAAMIEFGATATA